MSNKTGLYIHIPFCESKCPYCDFFSVAANSNEKELYVKRITEAVKFWAEKCESNISSVYFGGGTPNMVGSENLCKILTAVKKSFKLDSDAEITTELNPNCASNFDFFALISAGFNRLSFGMQSAENRELKILGRSHSLQDVTVAVKKAKSAGFNNISIDIMLGIPAQNEKSLAKSIRFCKDQGVTHISAYILKVEKGTPFYKNIDNLNIPDGDRQADLYNYAVENLEKSGYMQYEISNFAQQGFESRHNLNYWECGEYIGIGPSAYSFFNGERFHYPRSFKDFYNNIIVNDGPGGDKEEYIMLNLRLNKGLNFKEYQSRFNEGFPVCKVKTAERYMKSGFLTVDKQGIRLNYKGFLVSNKIISDLM